MKEDKINVGRRPNGEGSVYQLKDGTWVGSIQQGYKVNGKPFRPFVGSVMAAIEAQGGPPDPICRYTQAATYRRRHCPHLQRGRGVGAPGIRIHN